MEGNTNSNVSETALTHSEATKRKQLTKEQWQAKLQALLEHADNRKLKHGVMNDVATLFRVSRYALPLVWPNKK